MLNNEFHYGVIAVPDECAQDFMDAIAQLNPPYTEIQYSYSRGSVNYYYIMNDDDSSVTGLCEDLATLYGIPHNLFPHNLDDVAVVSRFTPEGVLMEFYTPFSTYVELKMYPNLITNLTDPKILDMFKWESNWYNQVHYGRVGVLKRQLEGK